MRDTHSVGDLAVSKLLARALEKGCKVSLPFSGGCAYDLVLDEQGLLYRAQCKAARLDYPRDEVLVFNSCAISSTTGKAVSYQGKVDIFLVYAPAVDKCYRMSLDEIGELQRVRLRLYPSKNNQTKGIRAAEQFEW